MSALHFIIFFAGWGAGSHGQMFANKSEAIKIIMILIIIVLIPVIRYYEMKQKSPAIFLSILLLTLLIVELIIISYLTFLFGYEINILIFFMAAMIISIITQIVPIYRQLRIMIAK
ncbi:hypothetical protein [Fulvivirga sp.]|uniref:hypothetical protein n=1 Tax=Fulvivirga sp. TaxID=1931237 RepID=UPI0032EEE3BC